MIDEKRLLKDLCELGRKTKYQTETTDRDPQEGTLKSAQELKLLMLQRVIKMIKTQPQINEWIPCNERLPEKGKTVIACTSDGTFAGQYHEEGWYRENMFFYDSEILVRDVIAWQPLPELYKEQSCAGTKTAGL